MAAEATELNSSCQDLLNRLDDNYLFLLHFVDQEIENLPVEERSTAGKWLLKLGTDSEMLGVDGKIKRNSYLANLVTCMIQGRLVAPFITQPSGDSLTLPNLETSKLYEPQERPDWLNKLMANEANKVHVGGKNFETYLSTKLFEDGRGACAYLAISVHIEGDEAAWVKIRPNQAREERIHHMYTKEMENIVRNN